MTLHPASPDSSRPLTSDPGIDPGPDPDQTPIPHPDLPPNPTAESLSETILEVRHDPSCDPNPNPNINLSSRINPEAHVNLEVQSEHGFGPLMNPTAASSAEASPEDHQYNETVSQIDPLEERAPGSWRRGEVRVDMGCTEVPVLEVEMRPLMVLLRVIGVGPPGWDASQGQYLAGWRGLAGFARAVAAAALLTLSVIAVLSIAYHALELDESAVTDSKAVRSLKTVGVVIVGGYQVNACVQVATMLAAAPLHARLLTAWTRLTVTHHIPLAPRTRQRCYLQVVFMAVFMVAMVTAAGLGKPRLFAHVLDGLAERLYLMPRDWLLSHRSTTGVRVAVAIIALHQFAINKGVIFYFTTHCHLLTAALATWNTHLSHALNEVWAGGWRGTAGGGVGGLVGGLLEGRQLMVDMVRDTQTFFSPVLQCYFASTVVIVCTELYLLAEGVGLGLLKPLEVTMLVLLTLQTSGLLVHVALAASAVQEQAEASGDVLCRGLPYTASDQDKFYVEQLTRALTISPLFITGGNFFTINRSFILTVVSVVASYFIVILQFTQQCGVQEDDTTTTTTMQPPNCTV